MRCRTGDVPLHSIHGCLQRAAEGSQSLGLDSTLDKAKQPGSQIVKVDAVRVLSPSPPDSTAAELGLRSPMRVLPAVGLEATCNGLHADLIVAQPKEFCVSEARSPVRTGESQHTQIVVKTGCHQSGRGDPPSISQS